MGEGQWKGSRTSGLEVLEGHGHVVVGNRWACAEKMTAVVREGMVIGNARSWKVMVKTGQG